MVSYKSLEEYLKDSKFSSIANVEAIKSLQKENEDLRLCVKDLSDNMHQMFNSMMYQMAMLTDIVDQFLFNQTYLHELMCVER